VVRCTPTMRHPNKKITAASKGLAGTQAVEPRGQRVQELLRKMRWVVQKRGGLAVESS